MSLENYPGISEKRKAKIFAMSDAELLVEIEKGRESIMPKCIPFMRAVLAERDRQTLAAQDVDARVYREAVLQETRLANAFSKEANDTSTKSNRLALIAILISLLAIVVSFVRGGE